MDKPSTRTNQQQQCRGMSGPAFDLLEEKRKKIANELAKLEKQVRHPDLWPLIVQLISSLHVDA